MPLVSSLPNQCLLLMRHMTHNIELFMFWHYRGSFVCKQQSRLTTILWCFDRYLKHNRTFYFGSCLSPFYQSDLYAFQSWSGVVALTNECQSHWQFKPHRVAPNLLCNSKLIFFNHWNQCLILTTTTCHCIDNLLLSPGSWDLLALRAMNSDQMTCKTMVWLVHLFSRDS